MALVTILEEQELAFVLQDGEAGATMVAPNPLVVGETYTVLWDGTKYECVAFGVDGETVAIGNEIIISGVDNGIPFMVVYAPAGTYAEVPYFVLGSIYDTADATHTVGIYQDVADEEPDEPETPPEPEEPEGIVLKDRNGNDVAYYGIETVTFDTTTEGKQQTFTKGEAVEGLEIEPDFSGGDMAVVAPEGKLIKSATVKKPEALASENITDGVTIAGVTGTYKTESISVEIEPDFRDYVAVDNVAAMEQLLTDEHNVNKHVKYTGETDEYVNGQFYQMIPSAEAAKGSESAAVETSSGTELTASIECEIGDLLIAAFSIRSDLVSLSSGWNLISTSQSTTDVNSSDSTHQTLSFAYKYATDTTESITVKQTTAARIYINMVAISGATGFTDTGYQYQNNATAADATKAIFTRPSGSLILWAATKSLWTSNGYPIWELSNDSTLIQLGTAKQSRLLLAIDTSKDETVTFTSSATSTDDAYICGALTIELASALCFVPVDTVPNYVENQIIKPPEGLLINQVTIEKPETLVPENIAEGVTIAGIGPGTHSGGGGLELDEEPWLDDVCFWDYDGTLILNIPLADAATLTELPVPPSHSGLTFQGWNYTLEQIRATEYPIDVGAVYIPSDGKTRAHLNITNSSYRAMFFNFSQTVSNGVSINWGDGTAATTVSGTGVVKATHTYSAIGEYDVVFTVVDGCVMTLGDGSQTFAGGSSSTSYYYPYLTELYIGNNVELGENGLRSLTNVTKLTLPRSEHIKTIPASCIQGCSRLQCIIIPDGVTELGTYVAAYASFVRDTVINGAVCLPESIQTIGTYSLYNTQFKRIVIPRNVTTLEEYVGSYNPEAKRFFMPDGITEFKNRILMECRNLRKVKLPESLVTIGDYCISNCNALKEIRIPRNVKTMGTNLFGTCPALRELYIPSNVESAGNSGWLNYSGVERVVIEGTTVFSGSIANTQAEGLVEIIHLSKQVPSEVHIKSYEAGINIWVPDESLAAYKAVYETGITYHRVYKLSEYRGKLPTYE